MKKSTRPILLTAAFILAFFGMAHAQLKEETMRQIMLLLHEKETRTPAQRKIASQLLQAVREARGEQMVADVKLRLAKVDRDANNHVKVDINLFEGKDASGDLLKKIGAMGGKVIYPSRQYHTIRAQVSLYMVESLAGYPEVRSIEQAFDPIIVGANSATNPRNVASGQLNAAPSANAPFLPLPKKRTFAERAAKVRQQLEEFKMVLGTGSVNSEGDRTHRADDARTAFGFAGQGIRIGVMSDSYNANGTAAASVASGDLPGVGNPLGNTTPVTVVQDYAGATDEGQAMLQIVHDIAPKAQLFFATADYGASGFAANILALRNAPNNCDIIIDDVLYPNEPVYQDGIIAQAVNTVTASGALYFSCATNDGSLVKNTSGTWEGDFNDAGSLAFAGSAKGGTIHNFGTLANPVNGDIITSISSQSMYLLNWADAYDASGNDYDLFLVDASGNVKASSTSIQDGTGTPIEGIIPPSLVDNDRLVVFKAANAQVRAFSIRTGGNGIGTFLIETNGAIYGHTAAADAFSVAATSAPQAYPSAFTSSSVVEYFSSDGPRRVFYNADGTAITPNNFLFGTNGGTVRKKPDITAADGVSSTLSHFNPFYGTSAAAPHAGAIAALLESANPSLTPAQIRNLLTSTALDIEAPGYDYNSGFGIVQAYQAMLASSQLPKATLSLGTLTATEGSFSNNNGAIEPGELGKLVVQLNNASLARATNVTATITTTTPGITITQGNAAYGTIPTSGNASNSTAPFLFAVSPSVACGTVISFKMVVSLVGGTSPQNFAFTVATASTCAAPPTCNPITIVPAAGQLNGATATPYSQLFMAAGGSGSGYFSYILSGALPVGINFSGNLLSGTTAQSGNFPISFTANDPTGCSKAFAYNLAIGSNAPASITATSGTPQNISPSTVSTALQATVYNSVNVGLSGVTVIFTAPTTGASGTFAGGSATAPVITDANGIATATTFTANSTLGSYTVTASTSGVATPASFSLTNSCTSLLVTTNADSGPGSLRYLIGVACPNATITFAPNVTFIALTSGEIGISQAVNIVGTGANVLTVSGGGISRVFSISVDNAAIVSISGITIRDGKPQATTTFNGGGGILLDGGIINISSCIITNNDATLTYHADGGGIDDEFSTVTINNCSISNNTALVNGGGITHYSGATMTIVNSTIANNTLQAGGGGKGGGIFFDDPLTLTNCTVYGNTGQYGGNLFNNAGQYGVTAKLKNSIISGGILQDGATSGADILGTGFVSADYNLVQSASGGTITGTTAHNMLGIDPKLFALANYGGTTTTLLPMPNSPVINVGDPTLVTTAKDQRGFPRKSGIAADMGAVETNYSASTIAGTPQSIAITKSFLTLLQAKITESGNNVVASAITFAAPTTGASGTFVPASTTTAVTTNSSGIATAPAFTANSTMGSYNVSGSIGPAFTPLNYALTNNASLPVLFRSVTATNINCTAQVVWETFSETNIRDFVVEYGTDGVHYTALSTLAATGNSTSKQVYRFVHTSLAQGINYYRIKEVDLDGTFVYSGVAVLANGCNNPSIVAYPNPVHNILTIVLPGMDKEVITITDAVGRRVGQYTFSGGRQFINMEKWAKGIYGLVIIKNGGTTFTLKVIKD